ncbi:MAG: alpha/beta hydrolase [Novosphingobium sp.]|nr:alpha/beta hydrolase [Novosphingobium sp.]
MHKTLAIGVAAGLGLAATLASAQSVEWGARPTFAEDGTVSVPAFELPPSVFSSKEAQALQAMRSKMAAAMPTEMPKSVEDTRKRLDVMMASQIAGMRKTFPVDMKESAIAGVPVRIFAPSDGRFDSERVLINLHGGAFSVCWNSCSQLESIPIASIGKYKVVSVNYRMAPEQRHPAGVEDVEKVYRDLLKTYKPEHIGIYGCSAGGALTAQAGAWLPAKGLPQAGALGIFGAGGARFRAGDSAYISGYVSGAFPPPAPAGQKEADMTHGYFDGSDMADKFISPALHQDVLKKFPPTIIITGTRAMDMSPAVYTNSMLMKAGVETDLIVAEAMDHCYIYQSSLPEAQDAYQAIIGFFDEHLGRKSTEGE